MITISFPPMQGYIVIESPITLNSLNKLPTGMCTLRPKDTPEKKWSYQDYRLVTWTLEPGEWWSIASVWYPRKLESKPYFNLPVISLSIHRSLKGRKWVKEKMAKMAVTHLNTPNFSCTDRNITCSAADLNGKVVLAPDRETALLYSKRILGQCNMSHNKNSRFTSLLLE